MAETPFVGRAREQAELARRCVRGALVTLLGPAGVGKSRLAATLSELVTGAELVRVPMRAVRGEDDAWDAVAIALGLGSSAEVRGAVASALLRSERGLLVDDADEVPASFFAELARLVDVPLLVTSRRRFGLAEEALFELSPLPKDDAVLLLDAWLLRVRGRNATEAERPWLHTIARQLDGLPLALELAAARTRVLGLPALSRRLDETSALASPRDRARSLEAAFESSWAALDASERSTLAQLTVFEGGFDLDSAEAVVRLPSDAPPLLDVLHELRDRSLLQAAPFERLELLRTFAAFVRGRSDEHLLRDAETRHAEHFARFFARERDASSELEVDLRERENLLAVLDRLRARHSPSSHEAELALRGLLGLAPLLLVRGPLHALAARLEPTLDHSARSGADLALLARASAMTTRVHVRLGDLARAERTLARARLLAAKVGDASGEVARAGVELCLARGDDPSEWLDALPNDPESALVRAEAWLARASRAGDSTKHPASSSAVDEEAVRAAQSDARAALEGDRRVRLAARICLARLGAPEPLDRLFAEAEAIGDLASLARLHVLRDGADGIVRARRLAEQLGDVRLLGELSPPDAMISLRVAPDASTVEVDGERIELGQRKALRGVLRALVDARVDAPRMPAPAGTAPDEATRSWDALLAAGWPDERVSAEAGMQRVRVAVSTLRKLGLASVIETVEGGYRLHPNVRVSEI